PTEPTGPAEPTPARDGSLPVCARTRGTRSARNGRPRWRESGHRASRADGPAGVVLVLVTVRHAPGHRLDDEARGAPVAAGQGAERHPGVALELHVGVPGSRDHGRPPSGAPAAGVAAPAHLQPAP